MRLASPGDFSTPVPSSPSSLLEVRLSMSRVLAIAGWELDLRSPLRLLNLVPCFAVLMDFCTVFFKSKSTVKVNRKIKHICINNLSILKEEKGTNVDVVMHSFQVLV